MDKTDQYQSINDNWVLIFGDIDIRIYLSMNQAVPTYGSLI